MANNFPDSKPQNSSKPEQPQSQPSNQGTPPPVPVPQNRSPNFFWTLFFTGMIFVLLFSSSLSGDVSKSKQIPWGQFTQFLDSDSIVWANIQGNKVSGAFVRSADGESSADDNGITKYVPIQDAVSYTRGQETVEYTNLKEAVKTFRKQWDSGSGTSSSARKKRPTTGQTVMCQGVEFEYIEFDTVIPTIALTDNGTMAENMATRLGKYFSASQEPDYSNWMLLLSIAVSIGIFVVFVMMLRRARDQFVGGGGGGVMPGFSRSPARKHDSTAKQITFSDVAGLENVKNELVEIVDYLKDPEKYTRMGARIPKGMLLMGPPGTGKTLLGRAIAGEAGVPFYVVNGSEFIQLYAGVGASRVRDLFATAKENSPAILFIDEIDAVGRHRGAGIGAGHDEREQTLNQILSEMDGFAQTESVMVMAATNRPDVLDPALLRPGRFDRHIVVERPSMKGRVAIFTVHIRGVPIDEDVDLKDLAKGTVGFTGADIKNLVNEATLWATRNNKTRVNRSDFDFARDKIMMGLRREDALPEQEKPRTAVHEAGHTIVAWFEPIQSRVHKVSIIPRGRALGSTQILPDEDQVSVAQRQLEAQLACLMAGRVAEKIVFNETSAGAEDDLKRATRLARKMVAAWGMSEKLGPVAFRVEETHPFLGREIGESREYSEKTGEMIDEEVIRILRESEQRATDMILAKRDLLNQLSAALETEEELEEHRITEILGESPFAHLRKAKEEE